MQALKVTLLDPGNFTPDYVERVQEGLRDLGWSTTWSTSPHTFDGRTFPAQEDFFVNLPRKLSPWLRRLLKLWLYPFGLWRLERRLGMPGILHVQWSLLPYLDLWFWSRWKRAGWKIVYTAHDVLPQAGSVPLIYRDGYVRLARAADAVVVHSRFGERVLARMGAKNVHLLPMGACLPHGYRMLSRAQARLELGLPAAVPILLCIGYLKPYKGLDVALEALPKVVDRHPEVKLLIAGEDTGSHQAGLKATIDRLSIASNVILRIGYIKEEWMSLYLCASDIVVLPYRQSSSSAILWAARECGRPVVASRTGGLREALRGVGLAFPNGDSRALGECVNELLDDPDQCERMGQYAREVALEQCGWGRLCAGLDSMYRKL